MKIYDEAFFKAIRNFLTVYLPKQRCYSPNTVNSYRFALNLFVDYLTVEKKFALSKLSFEHLRADIISGFLDWLQVERHLFIIDSQPTARGAEILCEIRWTFGYFTGILTI